MLKNKISLSLFTIGMASVGLIAGIAGMASAQTAAKTGVIPTNATVTNKAVDTPEPGDVADSVTVKTHGHAPLGGDGMVASISGTTIVIGEEANEGGAAYTVDASKATVTKNSSAAQLSDIKVGDKIFVQGAVSGTNVAATSVLVGHPGERMDKLNDTDGTAANETNEANNKSSSETSSE